MGPCTLVSLFAPGIHALMRFAAVIHVGAVTATLAGAYMTAVVTVMHFVTFVMHAVMRFGLLGLLGHG